MKPLRKLRAGWSLLRWREMAVRVDTCPFCGPTLMLRLRRDELGVRCARCAAGPVHLALGRVLRQVLPDIGSSDVCELSARGPYVRWLHRHAHRAAVSEYLDGVVPGSQRDGIPCEDVQRLSYADACFDLCTSTEVLEHVPDDAAAFAELHRVLRPGGHLLFSVPLHEGEHTVERARLRVDGTIEHLHEPLYHVDPIRPGLGALAFRDYGQDVLERVAAAGFRHVRFIAPEPPVAWSWARKLILAQRPA